MNRYLAALAIGIGLMAHSPAFAASIYGGAESCKTVTAYPDNSLQIGWVMGWVSGLNSAENITWSRAPTAHDIWDAILVYCVKNPQDDLSDAAERVYVDFLNKSM